MPYRAKIKFFFCFERIHSLNCDGVYNYFGTGPKLTNFHCSEMRRRPKGRNSNLYGLLSWKVAKWGRKALLNAPQSGGWGGTITLEGRDFSMKMAQLRGLPHVSTTFSFYAAFLPPFGSKTNKTIF